MSEFEPRGIHIKTLPLDSLDSDLLLAALHIWRSWCGSSSAPTWREVELSAFPPPLLPLVTVVDVLEGGRDFEYRYWGSHLTQLFGREETGRKLSERSGSASVPIRESQFREVIGNFRPMLFMTTFEKAHGLLAEKLNLRLPVSDHPEQVTKIVSLSVINRVGLKDYENLKETFDK
jgi:hypothetical protein